MANLKILRPLDTPHRRRDFPHLDPLAYWVIEMVDGTPKAHGPYAIPEEMDAAIATLEGRDPTCALCETGEEPGHEH